MQMYIFRGARNGTKEKGAEPNALALLYFFNYEEIYITCRLVETIEKASQKATSKEKQKGNGRLGGERGLSGWVYGCCRE